MSRWKYMALTCGLALACFAVLPTRSKADEFNKRSTLKVNEPLIVPGKVLQPGNYVLELRRSQENRNIVDILNEDGRLEATVLAFPTYRIHPKTGETLDFWEMPANQPRALRTWYFPGDNFGQEFAYPEGTAQTIAQVNQQAVPTTSGGTVTGNASAQAAEPCPSAGNASATGMTMNNCTCTCPGSGSAALTNPSLSGNASTQASASPCMSGNASTAQNTTTDQDISGNASAQGMNPSASAEATAPGVSGNASAQAGATEGSQGAYGSSSSSQSMSGQSSSSQGTSGNCFGGNASTQSSQGAYGATGSTGAYAQTSPCTSGNASAQTGSSQVYGNAGNTMNNCTCTCPGSAASSGNASTEQQTTTEEAQPYTPPPTETQPQTTTPPPSTSQSQSSTSSQSTSQATAPVQPTPAPTTLPQTDSPFALIGLLGLLSCGGALGLRFASKLS